MRKTQSGVGGPLLAWLLVAATAALEAQDSQPASGNSSPHAEIGVTASGIFASGTLPGIGVRIGGGNGGRVSIEGGLDWMDAMNRRRYSDQTIWFFFWQVKHRLPPIGKSSSLFAMYGTAGWMQRDSAASGFRASFIPPFLPLAGIGYDYLVAPRLSVRGDAQLLFGPFETLIALPRVNVGVSIPLGRVTR